MLETEELRFGYSRRREVICGIQARFRPGRTVLLGPNGAGKSTLLKLLAGVLKPSSGHIVLDGDTATCKAFRAKVGYLPQHVAPVPGLSVQEAVQYAAWLAGLGAKASKSRAAQALDMVGLSHKADVMSTTLSGGQVRRMGLASVLTMTPRVLILDEPTAGLDPAQRYRFREVLGNLSKDLIVVVSTHDVDDVEDTYDVVSILADGALRWTGTPRALAATAVGVGMAPIEAAYLRMVEAD